MAGSIIEVTDGNFQAEVIESDTPVLVDFWAPWCGPCRVVAPVLEEINSERDDLRIVKLNIDDNQQTAAAYGIMAIPTMLRLPQRPGGRADPGRAAQEAPRGRSSSRCSPPSAPRRDPLDGFATGRPPGRRLPRRRACRRADGDPRRRARVRFAARTSASGDSTARRVASTRNVPSTRRSATPRSAGSRHRRVDAGTSGAQAPPWRLLGDTTIERDRRAAPRRRADRAHPADSCGRRRAAARRAARSARGGAAVERCTGGPRAPDAGSVAVPPCDDRDGGPCAGGRRGGSSAPQAVRPRASRQANEEQPGTHGHVLDADPAVLKPRCQRSTRATEIASGRPSIVTGSPAAPS